MDNQKKKKILILGGPTASQKTRLGIILSQQINLEIINADSRQIYKYFDIGTNKGKIESSNLETKKIENFLIPKNKLEGKADGWLFDFLEPKEEFNVSNYQTLANNLIQEILNSQKVPLILGGTGLYIDSVIKNYELKGIPDQRLREKYNNFSIEDLKEELIRSGFDIESLNNSDRNNPHRLIRLLEKKIPEQKASATNSKYNYLFLYPEFEREKLMKKIDDRVEDMMDNGFVDEVKDLISKGFQDTKPMKGIGYKELLEFLKGKKTKEQTIERIKISHRQYAKRQITWFEGNNRGYNLNKVNEKNIVQKVKEFI
jgi:tRNA dimethylallyltransferase